MAGLGPAIALRDALCPPKRDARVKPTHDREFLVRAFIHRSCCEKGIVDRPYSLCGRRVRPYSFAPRTSEGDGAPSGASIQFMSRTVSDAWRLSARHRGVLLPAPGRASLRAFRARTVSQLLAGTPCGAGRSPAAARVQVCETCPRAPRRRCRVY